MRRKGGGGWGEGECWEGNAAEQAEIAVVGGELRRVCGVFGFVIVYSE